MTPVTMENTESTEYVIMYGCNSGKCPKSVWIICEGFIVEKSKCSLCKRSCIPMNTDNVSSVIVNKIKKYYICVSEF